MSTNLDKIMWLNRRVPVGTHGGVRGRLFRVERCFTFDEENAQVEWNERTLRIICKGKKYEIRVDENQTEILIKKYTDAEEKSWIVR